MTKDIQDNSDFEIVFCEGLLEKNPNFIEALTLLGELYTKKGLYEKGLEVDRKLSHLKPDDAIVFYNLACSYSLLKEIEKSFESLKKAVELGYDELSYMLEDKDLKNLREDKRFQEYFGSLEQQ
jgi:tetratricopeptide (TPR) repeat protein